jgi:hypothetical protein
MSDLYALDLGNQEVIFRLRDVVSVCLPKNSGDAVILLARKTIVVEPDGTVTITDGLKLPEDQRKLFLLALDSYKG